MGKLSRLRMLGKDYNERVFKAFNKLSSDYAEHEKAKYPKIEEDSEGIAYWESPKVVRMTFKGLTVNEGYIKTVNKFKLVNKLSNNHVFISIDGDKVKVVF